LLGDPKEAATACGTTSTNTNSNSSQLITRFVRLVVEDSYCVPLDALSVGTPPVTLRGSPLPAGYSGGGTVAQAIATQSPFMETPLPCADGDTSSASSGGELCYDSKTNSIPASTPATSSASSSATESDEMGSVWIAADADVAPTGVVCQGGVNELQVYAVVAPGDDGMLAAASSGSGSSGSVSGISKDSSGDDGGGEFCRAVAAASASTDPRLNTWQSGGFGGHQFVYASVLYLAALAAPLLLAVLLEVVWPFFPKFVPGGFGIKGGEKGREEGKNTANPVSVSVSVSAGRHRQGVI
jgi:hypothetical protein